MIPLPQREPPSIIMIELKWKDTFFKSSFWFINYFPGSMLILYNYIFLSPLITIGPCQRIQAQCVQIIKKLTGQHLWLWHRYILDPELGGGMWTHLCPKSMLSVGDLWEALICVRQVTERCACRWSPQAFPWEICCRDCYFQTEESTA